MARKTRRIDGVMDMRSSIMVLATAVALATTGCAQRTMQESGGDVDLSSPAGGGSTWGVTVRGIDGWSSTRASAFARPVETGTRVSLTLDGVIAYSRYAWDLREGTCGTEGTVVGNA